MANPYHDELGQFCSRNEMMSALDRLQKAGDVNGYITLREQFDRAEKENQNKNSTPSVGTKKFQQLDQNKVNDKLRTLGNKLLKEPYKSQWSEDNPTLGYCYVVSEAIYHYGGLKNPVPYVMSFPEGGTHWFIKDGDNIIDFTGEQFKFEIDRTQAVRCPFFKGGVETKVGYISKRGQQIAELLELV